MSERKVVKVSRYGKKWAIWCEICRADGALWLFDSPWLTAKTHDVAVIGARWHVAEHQARACDHCHRSDPLPSATVIDGTHINFDGKLWEVRADGIVPIGTAAPKAAA